MSQPHGALQGVKVISCSTAQAGTVPYMLMADLGAFGNADVDALAEFDVSRPCRRTTTAGCFGS
jgi:hypothetical protein